MESQAGVADLRWGVTPRTSTWADKDLFQAILISDSEVFLTTYSYEHNGQLHLTTGDGFPRGTVRDCERMYRRQVWVATMEEAPIQQVHQKVIRLPIN